MKLYLYQINKNELQMDYGIELGCEFLANNSKNTGVNKKTICGATPSFKKFCALKEDTVNRVNTVCCEGGSALAERFLPSSSQECVQGVRCVLKEKAPLTGLYVLWRGERTVLDGRSRKASPVPALLSTSLLHP